MVTIRFGRVRWLEKLTCVDVGWVLVSAILLLGFIVLHQAVESDGYAVVAQMLHCFTNTD